MISHATHGCCTACSYDDNNDDDDDDDDDDDAMMMMLMMMIMMMTTTSLAAYNVFFLWNYFYVFSNRLLFSFCFTVFLLKQLNLHVIDPAHR